MKKMKYPDERSIRFVLVPLCLMGQAYQARGIVKFKFSSVIVPIIEELMRLDLNIIQMPARKASLVA